MIEKQTRDEKKNRHIRTITTWTIVLLLVAQTLMVSVCFAEEDDFKHEALRGDLLFLEIPKSWQFDEKGSFAEDTNLAEDGDYVFQIAELLDQDGAKQGELWFCVDPGDTSFYYCDTEAEAESYFDAVGMSATEAVLDEVFPDAESRTVEAPTYIKGEDEFTYVCRQNVEVDGRNYLVYLTCEYTLNGGVHEMLIFEEPYDQEVCDLIGESPEGYSYTYELIENRLDGKDGGGSSGGSSSGTGYPYNDNETSFDLIRNVFMAIVTIAVFAFLFKVLKTAANVGGQARKRKQSFETAVMGGPIAQRREEKRSTHKAIDKWTLREFRKGKCDHEDMHIQQGTRYSGYQESLKTLHKSGLLTTKEMNELLEKHKNDL